MSELYIGLMSGTSADGVDAVLVDLSKQLPTILATHYYPFPQSLREKVLNLTQDGPREIVRMGETDILLAQVYAETVKQLLAKTSIAPESIRAIGSHGQTIRHHPKWHFTLQIGDPNTLAYQTRITTVADFRRKDLALGGEGAPLVPAFHQQLFATPLTDRAIVNIGGMANVTLLAKHSEEQVIGFDTGPGNVLLDTWIDIHQHKTFDKNGSWGAKGAFNDELLDTLLADPYFKLPPPKSTGREYFNLEWLQQQCKKNQQTLKPEDVQATLVHLTAHAIIDAIKNYFTSGEILICGGGAHNEYLMQVLTTKAAPHFSVASTMAHQLDPDWIEATAFAWLAKQTLSQAPGNLPSVTGAKASAILGGIYYP